MRPPAKPNHYFYHPLDAILGTVGNVRILRMLSLDETPVAPMTIAFRCALGRAGIWKALRRLERSGILERASGRQPGFPRYRLAASHPLTRVLRDLFERERLGGRSAAATALEELRAARALAAKHRARSADSGESGSRC